MQALEAHDDAGRQRMGVRTGSEAIHVELRAIPAGRSGAVPRRRVLNLKTRLPGPGKAGDSDETGMR